MLVGFLAAPIGLVDFARAGAESRPFLPRLANAMGQAPGGGLANAEVAMEFHAGDALEAGREQVNCHGSSAVAEFGALRQGAGLGREVLAALPAAERLGLDVGGDAPTAEPAQKPDAAAAVEGWEPPLEEPRPTQAQKPDAAAAVEGVPRGTSRRMRVQPVLRAVPGVEGAAVAGDAAREQGWGEAVRGLRRADGDGVQLGERCCFQIRSAESFTFAFAGQECSACCQRRIPEPEMRPSLGFAPMPKAQAGRTKPWLTLLSAVVAFKLATAESGNSLRDKQENNSSAERAAQVFVAVMGRVRTATRKRTGTRARRSGSGRTCPCWDSSAGVSRFSFSDVFQGTYSRAIPDSLPEVPSAATISIPSLAGGTVPRIGRVAAQATVRIAYVG